jgi:ABC-2 type transport system ATP-binding protein
MVQATDKQPGDLRGKALNTGPMVEIGGLTKRYGRTLALDAVSFEVRPNDLFALLGPNGAGKTTLLHILCTILRPDAGTARVSGVDVIAHPLQARQSIGVVFQEPSLDDRLTVYENLEFHGLVYGVPAARRRRRIEELLALVELADWRNSLARTLSSGMKRRLEIARALVHDARVLFLDEPTVGLDAQSRGRLWQHVRALRAKRELTVIVTTHYIEEMEGCDRVCIIDKGKILADDAPAQLKSRHGQQIVRVVAADDAAADEIVAAYPDLATRKNGEIVVKSSGDDFAEALLARCAGRIRRFSVEEPSLESVFLSLTGRELRDQAASPRERTYQFGRRGGEHTR